MVRGKKSVERVTELMKEPKHIRNIGIVAHIDHGKTTLSDNLLSGAGIISEELAGKQLFMDSDQVPLAGGVKLQDLLAVWAGFLAAQQQRHIGRAQSDHSFHRQTRYPQGARNRSDLHSPFVQFQKRCPLTLG